MNPLKLVKIKSSWDQFNQNHPQFVPFLNAVYPANLKVGTTLEIGVTSPDGKPLRYRMTVTEADMTLFSQLQELAE